MAIQSIVDFVRDGLRSSAEAAGHLPSLSDFAKDGQKASAEAGAPSRLESELAYAELLKPVVGVLYKYPQLAEGELFKYVDTAFNFTQFKIALGEMQSRGLVQIVEFRQPYNEPVYRLTSHPSSV